MGDLVVRINESGTIREFVAATENTSILRNNSGKGNLKYQHRDFASPFDVTFSDILSRLPELSEYYRRWRGRLNFTRFNREIDRDNGVVEVRVLKSHHLTEGAAYVRDSLSEGTLIDFRESTAYWHGTFNRSFSELPMLWDEFEQAFSVVGDLVFVRRIGNVELSKPTAIAIASYFLGMLVRYYPSKWIGLLNNGRSDQALPTLLYLVDYIEKFFPSIVLEFVEADRFDIAAAHRDPA